MANARFWVRWLGGWVKLTLAPDEEVNLFVGESTEEGFRREWHSYAFDGAIVDRDVAWRERDCDGMHSGDERAFATLADLRAGDPYDTTDPTYCPEPGAMLPTWREAYAGYRDHTAEAAGY